MLLDIIAFWMRFEKKLDILLGVPPKIQTFHFHFLFQLHELIEVQITFVNFSIVNFGACI